MGKDKGRDPSEPIGWRWHIRGKGDVTDTWATLPPEQRPPQREHADRAKRDNGRRIERREGDER